MLGACSSLPLRRWLLVSNTEPPARYLLEIRSIQWFTACEERNDRIADYLFSFSSPNIGLSGSLHMSVEGCLQMVHGKLVDQLHVLRKAASLGQPLKYLLRTLIDHH